MKIRSLLVVAVLATAILFSGGIAKAQTSCSQTQISQLMAQLAQLTAQLQSSPVGSNDRLQLQLQILQLQLQLQQCAANSAPSITSLSPSSGPVGTIVQITGSGFTNNNDIAFVGSTNPVVGSSPNTVSPIDGEIHYTNVNSPDGKTLTFTIPSQMAQQTNENGTVSQSTVVPGIYYVVIQTANGKSGPSYFTVTSTCNVDSDCFPGAMPNQYVGSYRKCISDPKKLSSTGKVCTDGSYGSPCNANADCWSPATCISGSCIPPVAVNYSQNSIASISDALNKLAQEIQQLLRK